MFFVVVIIAVKEINTATQTVKVAKSFSCLHSAVCRETVSIWQVRTVTPWEWSQAWDRSADKHRKKNDKETNEAMQNKWEGDRLREWEHRDEESMKQNEGVRVMMTIHHYRHSQCITRWHEWLLSMSERCRPDPSIPSDCSTHEWWLLPGCSGSYTGLRDGNG